MGSDLIHQRWKLDYERLHEEIDLFMRHFDSIKKCHCPIDDCKHFEKERDRIFGKRIDDIFNSILKNGFQTFAEIDKSIKRY